VCLECAPTGCFVTSASSIHRREFLVSKGQP